MRVAIIGSRKTPPDVCGAIESIASYIADSGGYVTSGHADGADYAAEKGALKRCLVYLPWKTFNQNLPMLGSPWAIRHTDPVTDITKIVKNIHQSARSLRDSHLKLHQRNVQIILGASLTQPVDCVLYWTPGITPQGGTRTGVVLAKSKQIPTFKMTTNPAEASEFLDKVEAHS